MVPRPALPRNLPLDLVATAAKWLQLCLTLCDPMDYRPTVFSVHETLQARILEWVGIYFSRGPSQAGIKPLSLTSPELVGRFLFSSVQFSCSVMFNCLWPHALQHTRLPCPSPTPGAYSNSCPLSLWCHPTISSSVIPFSSCLRYFPASGSFPKKSGGQSIGVSALASVLPMNIQDWFPLGRTVWISLQSKRPSRVFNTTVQMHQFFGTQLSL